MSDNAITRVQYFEGQFLRTQDFTTEQGYHVAMRRRHNIAHHIWGIVAGLGLEVDSDQTISVSPGMAVDGYGRELVLPERQQLSHEAFDERDSDTLGVWLIYERVGSDQAPTGYAGCGSNGASPNYRWQERPRLRMDIVDPGQPDMRQPLSVPDGDLDFDPTRTPPDNPEDDWPVFLGAVRRQRASPQEDYTYTIVQNEYARPYAGLVGERINAPSGLAALQLGAASPDDNRRFAVFVHDPAKTDNRQRDVPPLELDQAGATTLRGKTAIHANVTLDGGAIAFAAGSDNEADAVSPPVARPWQIYRYVRKEKQQAEPINRDQQQNGSAEETLERIIHELRIEMAGKGRGDNRVVVGTWSPDDKQFKPCLTIGDNYQVTVHGNLLIEGTLTEKQSRPTPKVSQQYQALALSASLGAINKALDKGVFDTSSFAEIAAQELGKSDGRQTVIRLLLSNTSWLQDVVNGFIASPEGQRIIIEKVAGSPDVSARVLVLLLATENGRATIANGILRDQTTLSLAITRMLQSADGRDSLVNILLADGETGFALGLVLERLLLTPEGKGRGAAIEVLLRNAAGREAMALALVTSDAGIDALVQELLVQPVCLASVLRSVFSDDAGRQAIVNIILQNDDTLKDVIAELLKNDKAQTEIIAQLLAEGNQDGRREVLKNITPGLHEKLLEYMFDIRQVGSFLDLLIADERGRLLVQDALLSDHGKEILTNLLSLPSGQTALINVLLDKPDLHRLLDQDLLTPEQANAVQRLFFENPNRRRIIVLRLLGDAERRRAVVDILFEGEENQSILQSFLNIVLEGKDGRRMVIDSIKQQEVYLNDLLLQALDNDQGTGPRAFAQVLVGASSGRCSQVADALTESTDNTAALAELLNQVLDADAGRAAFGQALSEDSVRTAFCRYLRENVPDLANSMIADLQP